MTFVLTPGTLTLTDLKRLAAPGALLVDDAAWRAVAASAHLVAEKAAGEAAVYGVNTGFGLLAKKRIPAADVAELQVRLVRSHAVGVGEPLPDEAVRLALALKINGLARGYSGVRRETIEALASLYNADVLPLIPAQGSVGASGDLAPLAHLALVPMGEGQARHGGQTISGAEALRRAGLAPLRFAAKEGLALLNGTQISTALALIGLFAAERVFQAALVSGALSIDAAAGSDTPFDARIHAVRGQPGQSDVAAALRGLIAGSPIRESHRVDDPRVQDAYSLRCQPQVMGAALDLIRQAAQILVREANAVSDNPLVFVETGEILSGGNFHAEPVAFAADLLAMALSETVALAERRIALLMDPGMSGLPAFLVPDPGLNSGFMIVQVAAAALAAEIKHTAHPASLDSLPTSANQEDHVSMATHAARRLGRLSRDAAAVVAMELLAAAQGVDLRKPLRTSPALSAALAEIRRHSDFVARDRSLSADIAAVTEAVLAGRFGTAAPLLPAG